MTKYKACRPGEMAGASVVTATGSDIGAGTGAVGADTGVSVGVGATVRSGSGVGVCGGGRGISIKVAEAGEAASKVPAASSLCGSLPLRLLAQVPRGVIHSQESECVMKLELSECGIKICQFRLISEAAVEASRRGS